MARTQTRRDKQASREANHFLRDIENKMNIHTQEKNKIKIEVINYIMVTY